jgi:putative IMPACT (imprinted ancient) family translation regulator
LGSKSIKFKIGTLKARIEASRQYSASIASEFKKASTSTEKTRIAFRYGEALNQTRSLERLLEMIERKETEANGEPSGA